MPLLKYRSRSDVAVVETHRERNGSGCLDIPHFFPRISFTFSFLSGVSYVYVLACTPFPQGKPRGVILVIAPPFSDVYPRLR